MSFNINDPAIRFDINNPNLCHGLRWKTQFIGVENDPEVPSSAEGLFWCVYTQTCIGPDNRLAEPGNCSSKFRECHGSGKCAGH
jgi:hypothetical protein